jgi:hypothetical protein
VNPVFLPTYWCFLKLEPLMMTFEVTIPVLNEEATLDQQVRIVHGFLENLGIHGIFLNRGYTMPRVHFSSACMIDPSLF